MPDGGQCTGETALRLLPAAAGDVYRDFLLMGEDARGNPARQVEPRHLTKLLTSYACDTTILVKRHHPLADL